MNAGVATQLPDDATKWAANGFVTVSIVGGTPNQYIPIRQPILQIDAWAVHIGSAKPPWWKASTLLEQVRMACYDLRPSGTLMRPLQIVSRGVTYPPVRVMSAWILQEPRRSYTDAGDYARYVAELQMHWVTLSALGVNG
jgi:hypothetical protein